MITITDLAMDLARRIVDRVDRIILQDQVDRIILQDRVDRMITMV